ncbi:Asp23/Gls24 family envelope stress response protein [Nocardia sp. NPDC051570]|uniref:Asp23/Gls24 family envelope stress response protein n=1 Tax=Nocardia sp. NPDC051570 TaxID=3364324 RepID=UPI0037BA8A9E
MTQVAAEPELVVSDTVVAALAARAAAAVPGVARLEIGLRELVGALTRAGKRLWSGQEFASTDGVRVRSTGDGVLAVQIDLAVAAGHRAAEVGVRVQQEVMRVVAEQAGVRVDEVSVQILDVDPEPR